MLQPNITFANHYLLGKKLGIGGFSEVWKARDQIAEDSILAVKIYAAEKGMDEFGLKHFRRKYAARGGQNFKYSGSNNLGSVAWYRGNSGERTHPVGSKSPNGYGLYDMSGNVWEWCIDWYKGYPDSSGVTDRTGSGRVARGGGWNYFAHYCRVSSRSSYSPENRGSNLGFRLAL